MNIADITTNQWQPSMDTPNEIVTDFDDVNQCVRMIVGTQKGSDPLWPLFGIDIMKWIDRPVTMAVPNLIKEITSQLSMWEKRITVQRVEYSLSESQVTFIVHWTYQGKLLTTSTNYVRSS